MTQFSWPKITAHLIVLIFLISIPCLGQVNVENQRMSRDSSGISGSVNFSVEIERGNSDLTEISLEPRMAYRFEKNLWFIINKYSFVRANDKSVMNEGFSHLRYNYNLSQLIIIEALAQLQYNREQQLKRRYLLGSGIRLKFINKERSSLALGITAMYEYERLENGEIFKKVRNSNYLATGFKINKVMTLSNTAYVQPLFDDPHDIRVLNDLNISFAISKWLAMTLEAEYQYDSRPPENVKEYDFSLKNGLTVRF